MSILSTSSKLVKVGGIEYSAGSGISIDDYVISVSGEFGKTYSAGDNIGIYEQDNQLYISGKDWTDDINAASANAYEQATAMIPPEFDPSFISGSIDSISGELENKLNSSSFNNWLDGQYTSDISHIEGEINYISGVTTAAQQNLDYLSGQIDNKLDTDTFTAWSAAQAENDYDLSAGSGISLYNDDVNKLTRIDVTGTFGNPEVEEYVQTNSGTINEVNSIVETNSASWNEISAISGTYMATYGSTTLNQISNAIGSGLDVYCRYNDGHGRILSAPLASNGYGTYTFTTTYNNNVYYFVIQPNGGDGAWSISSNSILTAQIQSDWDVTATDSPAYIQNKPDLSVYTTSAQVSAMIDSACDTKFVAELYTTPYDEILSAYNEGKTIVLSPVSGSLLSYDELNNQFTFAEETYISDDLEEGIGHTNFQYYFVDNNNDWTQRATISNVQADWNQVYSSSPDYIKNKPDLSIYTTSAQVSAMVESADNLFKVQKDETPFSAIQEAGYDGKKIVYRRWGQDYNGICLGVGGVGIPISFLVPSYHDNSLFFNIDTVDNENNWSAYEGAYYFNVQADWNQTLSGEPDYIKNKPDLEDYAKVSALNDYVPFSAEEIPIGDSNTATNTGFAQGNSNSADNASLAQGYYNSASTYSLAQGGRNYAYQDSFAQGIDNSATQYSLAQGKSNSAYNYGVAIGSANSAFNYSQAFGRATVATASGMAIGTYNKTEDAAFVIGDGESEYVKSDSFIVYHDGSVSSKGKISAAGEELGAGTTITYDYTSNDLISAIDTSALFATSADTANQALWIPSGKRLDENIYWSGSEAAMFLNPKKSPFTTTSGVYSMLQYATGASLDYYSQLHGNQYYGGFFKGNQWFISDNNPNIANKGALIGEVHRNRSVYISGSLTAGAGFVLHPDHVSGRGNSPETNSWKLDKISVSGLNSTGSWNYGVEEDTKLRNLSAQYDELKASYDALSASYDTLSSLFATYSGQWLLPNEGV